MKLPLRRKPFVTSNTLAGGVLVLGGLALANHLVARQTERRHPADGKFVEVDGVRLHYVDCGSGTPVVLIHGNAVSGNDWSTSGVVELLMRNHRVIIFDRPGCGHSERPRGKAWTAAQQAELLFRAVGKLDVRQPVVVGHSWGAIVALSLAQQHGTEIGGLVLMSGYYFWTFRPDALMSAPGALPIVGDILRYTLSPLLGWLQMPLLKKAMFSPAPVPARFEREYSIAMALRPSQIRATSIDGVLVLPSTRALESGYQKMDVPAAIIAGSGDKIVFSRTAERLHQTISGSSLEIVDGAGHMVHHVAPEQVVDHVERISNAARIRTSNTQHA